MAKLKTYVVLAALACLVVLAAGWMLLVSPARSHASDLQAQASAQDSANAQLAVQLRVLQQKARDLPSQQAKLAAVSAKIPSSPALPDLVRQLTPAAATAGVELVSVTPGAAKPVATTGGVTAPTKTTAAPAPAGGAGQLASIPITLNVVGSYFQVEQFLTELESLPRALRVTTVTMTPGANPVVPATAALVQDGRSLTATITGEVYTAPQAGPIPAVTVPQAK